MSTGTSRMSLVNIMVTVLGYSKFQGAEVGPLTCQVSVSIPDRNKRNTMVNDLVVLVRGGASEHITALAYKELPTTDLMQEWGDAVQYNPDIIKIKVSLGNPFFCSVNSLLGATGSQVGDTELKKTHTLISRHTHCSI